jgi:hypothetical protein
MIQEHGNKDAFPRADGVQLRNQVDSCMDMKILIASLREDLVVGKCGRLEEATRRWKEYMKGR